MPPPALITPSRRWDRNLQANIKRYPTPFPRRIPYLPKIEPPLKVATSYSAQGTECRARFERGAPADTDKQRSNTYCTAVGANETRPYYITNAIMGRASRESPGWLLNKQETRTQKNETTNNKRTGQAGKVENEQHRARKRERERMKKKKKKCTGQCASRRVRCALNVLPISQGLPASFSQQRRECHALARYYY